MQICQRFQNNVVVALTLQHGSSASQHMWLPTPTRQRHSKISEASKPPKTTSNHNHEQRPPQQPGLQPTTKKHNVLHKVFARSRRASTIIPRRPPPILRRAVSARRRACPLDAHHSTRRGCLCRRKGRAASIELRRGYRPYGPQLHQGWYRPRRQKRRRVPRVAMVLPRRHQEERRRRG